MKLLIWARGLLRDLGMTQESTTIFQDNQSAIAITKNAYNLSDRSRHLFMRCKFIKELIDKGKIKLVYKNTKEMAADSLTKPITGRAFSEARAFLLNFNLDAP